MFKNFNNQKKNGYTMIEIIVVMSIIGFIVAATWYYFNYSRMLTRDTKRMADIEQVRRAIIMFRDENGRYPGLNSDGSIITSGPDSINNGEGECAGDQDSAGNNKTGITPCGSSYKKFELVIKDFIQNIPADPKHNCTSDNCNTSDYFYSYDPYHACGSGATCSTLCFNKSETNKYICANDNQIPTPPKNCSSGTGDIQQNQAAYCVTFK